ncbi:MAG: hypothetical protein MEP57_05140 [Microvirga sp.]|nr:hypothetical protein [Microvirga sp.]
MPEAEKDGVAMAVEGEGDRLPGAIGALADQEAREEAMSAIGRAWDEGVASGPASDGEEAFARIRRRLAGSGC